MTRFQSAATTEVPGKQRRLVAAIYAHPEGYPPTLNALTLLSPAFDEVDVLYRPLLEERFVYPANVKLHASGERMSEKRQMTAALPLRYAMVARFCRDLYDLVRDRDPELIIVYDPLALLAVSSFWPFLARHPLLWYHNHDVTEYGQTRPMSLRWFASIAEKLMWPRLDVFSLPARERERYFPMASLRGRYFFLPNWPTLAQINREGAAAKDHTKLRLIFQGRVSEGHGIEEIVAALPLRVAGREVVLVLAGWVTPEFEATTRALIARHGAESFVEWAGYRPYAQLHELTASCDVGIAVYRDVNVMNASVATASNKIYEYAACGLPVIYLDTAHFRDHLSRYAWATAWDGTTRSLGSALEQIVEDYDRLSSDARQTCRETLNFERHFAGVMTFVREQHSPGTSSMQSPE